MDFSHKSIYVTNDHFYHCLFSLLFIKFKLLVGVEYLGGNMFESVPNGETIFMKVGLNSS